MKALKSITVGLLALIFLALYSCSKEGEYALQDPPPLDFKVYVDGFDISFVNNAEGATAVSWDFGDDTEAQSGDSVVHRYSAIGNYLISMTGTVEGQGYTYHKVLRVDKPSVIKLDDHSFNDWNEVTYPDFQLSGSGDVLGGKVDYDANNVYIFVEFNAVEGADLDSHIFGIYMDTDNSVSTGFSMKEMGVDYGLEGNLAAGNIWPSMVDLVNGDSGWPFVEYDPENPVVTGTIEKAAGVIKMEFAIPRETYEINSDAFQFSMSIMNSDWSDIGALKSPDSEDHILVEMDKE